MRRICALLVMSAVIALPALARVKELNIVLKWNPNEKSRMPALDTTGGLRTMSVAPMVDKRDKGKQVGENTEEKAVVPVYTTSDVPEFVRDRLVQQLRRGGLDVSADDTVERVLKSELTEFWVTESSRYAASVRVKVTVLDARGKEVWSGLISGASDNFGRSLKPDNYTEGFSNAIQDLAAKLVAADGFGAAVRKAP
jgi:hypothetical protein